MTACRVLIAGGGTGGHIYPGIAIAREMIRRNPNSEVLFVGTERGLEAKIVPDAGFRLATIAVAGLKGVTGRKRLASLLALPKSLWQSSSILRQFKPGVVVGVGGYSSGPPVLIASLMGIPTMLQEQNAQPGLTNRLLARFVRKVAAAFGECEKYFGAKMVLTGNPVRPEFIEIGSSQKDPLGRQSVTVLITGGSQGARAINQAVMDALKSAGSALSKFEFIHQTGDRDHQTVLEAYQRAGVQADVRPFLADMARQFSRADLIICRAGAATLAEITVAGKAAILIPFPDATDEHQRKNAESLVEVGAAEMILQQDLDGNRLAGRLNYYYEHREILRRMEENSRRLGKPDATACIADIVETLAGSN